MRNSPVITLGIPRLLFPGSEFARRCRHEMVNYAKMA
jgi:hypothetical protein